MTSSKRYGTYISAYQEGLAGCIWNYLKREGEVDTAFSNPIPPNPDPRGWRRSVQTQPAASQTIKNRVRSNIFISNTIQMSPQVCLRKESHIVLQYLRFGIKLIRKHGFSLVCPVVRKTPDITSSS